MNRVNGCAMHFRRRLKCLLTLIMGAVLVGCSSTPDLGGWAQNSADLAGAISGEHKKVLTRLNDDIVQLKIGEQEEWNLGGKKGYKSKDWQINRKIYKDAADKVDLTMTVMVEYADALADLAASGETGKDAANSIVKSVNSILKTVGAAHPVGSAATKVLEEIAEIVTEVQAQNSLAETMGEMQPVVDALAKQLTEYTNVQEEIIDSLKRLERTLVREAAGPNRMAWYAQNRGHKIIEGAFAEASEDIQTVSAKYQLIQLLEPDYRERERKRDEVAQWVKARKMALTRIREAANAWQASHTEARTVLEECGGLRVLRPVCGNYTAANLKLAADRIREVVAAVDSDD